MWKAMTDNAAADWEISLDSRYTEDEVVSIMNMLSYWDNKHRGYGKKNDEQLYLEERKEDVNNKLYDEAMRGLFLLETKRKCQCKKKSLY